MRILIVEDDALIGLLTEDLLTDAGHTVVGMAPTKLRALGSLQQTCPDLVLVDLRLADGATGQDLVNELSQRGIAVIVVSALPRGMAMTGLTVPFVPKPFEPEMLLDAIAALKRPVSHSAAA